MRSMIDSPEIRSLGRFLDLDVFRQGVITSNLANIDTPGYRARDINFRQELDRAAWSEFQDATAERVINPPDILQTSEDAAFTPLARRVSGLVERPDGNNVSLERESLLLAETQLRFNLGIQILRAQFHMLSEAIHEGSAS